MKAYLLTALSRLTRALPPEDRVWGEALLGELDAMPRRQQLKWSLGLIALNLSLRGRHLGRQNRPGLPADTARTGLWIGLLVGGLIVGVLAWSNLGPPSKHPTSDAVGPVIAAYGLLFAFFLGVGFLERGRRKPLAACTGISALAASVMVVLAFLETTVVDNVWLSTIAQQPDKIQGLAHSPFFHTMRVYVNAQNLIGVMVVTPFSALAAGLTGALGGWLRDRGHGR